MRYPPRSMAISASYTDLGNVEMYELSSTGTLTLAPPSTKRRVTLCNTGTGVWTIVTSGTSMTIDGLTSFTLASGKSRTLVANGLNGSSAAWRTQDGTQGASVGRAYTNVAASTAISNVTAETAFDTNYSIPAGALKVGTKIRIRYQGIATATNSTDTLAIKLYLATDITAGAIVGTVLISHAATDVADNNVWQGEFELIIRTVGASGTIVGCGTYKSVPAAEGTMTIKDDILASTAIDTTVAQIVAVTATWSVASVSNSCRNDVMIVEIS